MSKEKLTAGQALDVIRAGGRVYDRGWGAFYDMTSRTSNKVCITYVSGFSWFCELSVLIDREEYLVKVPNISDLEKAERVYRWMEKARSCMTRP